MDNKIYNVLGIFVTVSKLSSIDNSTIEKIKNLKSVLDVGLALISCRVIISEHALLSLVYNIASAHKYGYNKLRKLDSELILVLAGKNVFHEAVDKITPKAGDCTLIVLLSDDKSKIQKAESFIRTNLSSELEEANLKTSFSLNDLGLIEKFALFYVWYK
ncbi:MAG: hypothetical protein QXS21_00875 [Thermoproteota archaeon]|nr:hypothetical protein [Candidatus Brockarchaeota archaeon]MBO3762633.1 hypothetical protein [Candidatus Brockarchaeota archaeon]MBO3768590.1 hypothetical protein [Candidatus Brockarchaeota archaeon]MBO3800966.1 hypothetical protein [Candidatus Brockarchaeota archaeon]